MITAFIIVVVVLLILLHRERRRSKRLGERVKQWQQAYGKINYG